jgi:hypothetical protein
MPRFYFLLIAALFVDVVSTQQVNVPFYLQVLVNQIPKPTPCTVTEIAGLKAALTGTFIQSAAEYYGVSSTEIILQNEIVGTFYSLRRMLGRMIAGQDDRSLPTSYKVYSGSGAYSCRYCKPDDNDRDLLEGAGKSRFEAYMSSEMTKDIMWYTKSSLAISCLGSGENVQVVFSLTN